MLNNCRICLKSETDLLNTASVIDDTTYNEELFFCVPEIDWKDDNKPSLICYSCTRNLKIAAGFRRLCLESHKVRAKYIKQLNNVPGKQENSDTEKELKLDVKWGHSTKLEAPENDSVDDDNTHGAPYEDDSEIEIKEATGEDKNTAQNRNRCNVKYCTNSKANDAIKSIHTERDGSLFVKTITGVAEEYETINEISDDIKLYVPSRKDRTCIFCSCTFSKYTTLANHVRSVHTFEKCFKCELCGEGFTNSEILTRHKNRHTGERKYVCSYCGKKFFTNSDLNHHVQRHQNKRNYKCDVCVNKSFNTANSLRTHKLVVHTNPNEWKYLCPICGRKCVTQASLTVHMKRHSNEKDFGCHLCSKKFCTKSELRKHISSHSNMRLHKCEICNQEYKDRKVMERHLTKKHGIGNARIVERVKKYICNVCPKKFVGKRQLEKHLRSHSGVRPFKCELCEQAFICSSYIKGHMRNKHSANV